MKVDALEVVARSPPDHQLALRVGRQSSLRHGNAAASREKLSGQRIRVRGHFLRGATGHHTPAMLAGTRPHVHHIIRSPDGIFIVLHHDHRIAQVTQTHEGFQQAMVITLMQPDGRLVEHIHHAREARADLRGQANALGLAAGKRARGTVQAAGSPAPRC